MAGLTFSNQKLKKDVSASQEILLNHDWFSEALMSKEDAVIATDQRGAVTEMNKLAEELTGWSMSESKGKPIDSIFDAIHESTRLPIDNPINKALKENKVTLLANHTILIKRDKTQRIIMDSAVPLHNSNKEVIGGALIFRDVTEQTNAKKKLAESDGFLKGIMGNISLVIDIKDLDGKYLLVNQQEEKVYGIKASELIGKKSAEHLTMEQTTASGTADMMAVKEKRLVEYEQVIKHPDGTFHTYSTSKFPLYNSEKEVYAVCSVSTDISEGKKNNEMKEMLAIQEVILKSDIRYDELTKTMPNMFFSLDSTLHHTSFNTACEKFTGKKEDEVIGKTIEEVFPDVAPMFIEACRETLETGKAKNFTSTFTDDENILTYIVDIYPTEKGISVLMTDLTKQKKSELETLELIYSLQKKNKDLRQFAYTASHDLRAPIARVLGLVALFSRDPKLKINNKSILEIAVSELTHLDNVVKDMNSTISVRDEEKQKEYIAFETELKQVENVLEFEIAESKAVITFDFQKAEGIVTVKSFLYSIMYNLLSNAIKYRSHDVPLTIHLETQQDNEFICLSVKDNGTGIDMKKNGDKIFGLYNRFHGKEIEGTGIGLNLVKAQIESLGGKAEVESEINHGSTFKIFFPVQHNQEVTE
ncbi:MAG: PAS domain S-box protein [Bacteroidia bacterium]|nr:PAS domain S-box protein [Bacteroidia bacterium]